MDIFKRMDEYILARANKDKEIHTHWPSNSSCLVEDIPVGKCLRAQWYGWTRVPPTNPVDLDTAWKFFLGDCVHIGIASILDKINVENIKEAEAFQQVPGLKYPVHGKADILFMDTDWVATQSFTHGLEIKTTFGRAITDPKTGVKYNGPKINHLLQMITYMKESGNIWYLFYIGRDTGWRYHFKVKYDFYKDEVICDDKVMPITWRGIIERWQVLEIALKTEVCPSKDYELQYSEEKLRPLWLGYKKTTRSKRPLSFKAYSRGKGDWQCSYCLWKDLCWAKK